MAKTNGKPNQPDPDKPAEVPAITSLTVSGFKSIATEQTLDIRPLTILAGANSSGKSSMMQPLLLLKRNRSHLDCALPGDMPPVREPL